MNPGDTVLYSTFAIGVSAIILLVINQFRKEIDVDVPLKWMIRVFSGLLIFDFFLLTYYFVNTNLTINYVWTFSSRDLPMLYKLSGVLAGQQGTLLFWALFIGLPSLWLSERRGSSDFIKKTQIVLVSLCLFFIGLTLKDSPFKTIYQLYPDISKSFVPADGNGLNPLLIDPWMAVHPPIIFIAYAAMAVPFALAVVYLFISLKDDSKRVQGEWIKDVIMWCRISWIFLTLGIAIGGFWAYKVLGWGGFWSWDPVETSSLVPWFLLTGGLHALVEHKKDGSKYRILAPLLVSLSFTMVLYATLVTRSGFFESVHAFDAGGTGLYILIMTVISALIPLTLAVINTRTEEHEEEKDGKLAFVNRTNIFYLAIVLFVIFTFVSFWGMTFPAISRLVSGNKIGIGASFYNLWGYPVIIAAMLLAGLALNYKASTKEKSIREFLVFLGITVVAGFIKPSEAWNLVDYSAIVNTTEPFLYSLIGSVSILSFIPPSIYLVYSAIERFKARLVSPKKRYIAKQLGISVIHIGVALIVIGSVFSYALDSEFPVSLNSEEKGKLTLIPGSPYGVKLLGYETLYEYKDVEGPPTDIGISVGEFYDEIHGGLKESYTIHGDVGEVVQTPHNTYAKLVDGNKELWVATNIADIPEGAHIVATGSININFKSSYLNTTLPVLLMAPDFDIYSGREIFSTTQQIKVAVYKGRSEIAEGIAESVTYFNGDVQRVMIDRGIKGDVYVILNGIYGKNISLDVRIKPLVNLVWAGVIFFTLGMLAVLAFDSTSKKRGK